ncbi:GSCOCG00011147001-RA-CDS, partial [Cotesia congregata]
DDEDEYKPDSNEESSESEYDENHEFQDDDELDADLRTEQTFSDSLNDTITVDQNSKASAPDDRELLVDPTSRTAKKHFCLFCKKFQAKIARHLQLKHHDQEEVKKFMALPVRSQERQQIISVIRKNGDHVYNSDRQFNSGKLIVCRRPAACREKKAEDFIACGNCKGQYSRLVIRHHWRKCTKQNSKGQRIVLVKGKKVSARLHERANADVRKHIFPYLREDEVVRSIRYDELLIVFANKQCEQYGTNQHLYQMVRSRLRLLGRLLVAIKSLNSHITSFTHIFQPRHYDFLIEAVKKVAVFLPETKTFLHPAVGSTIGTLLKKVGEILRSEYIKKEEKENQKKVEDFLKLLEEDYGTSINRIVTETQTQHFRTKEVVLPSTNDIQKLYKYLVDERNKYFQELQVKFSFKSWKKLSEMTLLSLLVFNRRRPGEIERLFVKNFQSCRGINDMADREIYETLAPEGKALAKRYKRFEIRGKRNRTVAVLVDEDLKECMDLVFKYRKDAQVSRKNEYFFGMPSLDKDRHRSLGACYLLRQHAAKCGADFPCHLRGTKLRKHVATRCINLNLEGNQVTDLANFMGHHEDIHKKIYRQPVAATDIVKMSKILQMVQGVNDSSDDSSDDEAEPSTSRVTMSEPNVSQSDSVYGPDTSRFSVQSRINQSSLKFDNSAPKTWTDEAKSTVLSAFKRHLENGNVPSGKEMQELINTHDCFKGRSVPQMRSWLHTYKKK